jgi:hypothetical protein
VLLEVVHPGTPDRLMSGTRLAARSVALCCLAALVSGCTIPLSRPALAPSLPSRATPHRASVPAGEEELYEVIARLAKIGWKYPSRTVRTWQILVREADGSERPLSGRQVVDEKPGEFLLATPELTPLSSYAVAGDRAGNFDYQCRFAVSIQRVSEGKFAIAIDDESMVVWVGREFVFMQGDVRFLTIRPREVAVKPTGYESAIVMDTLVRVLR